MSLASDLLEKMTRKGQLKIKPEPLSSEKPVEPSGDKGVDREEPDQPETGGGPGHLFSGSEGQSLSQDPGTAHKEPGTEGVPSDEEMGRLRKPLPILSQYLDGTVVYLVRDEKMAQEVQKQGRVAFTPEEIIALSEKFHSKDRGEWVLFLKAVCLTKKTFEGSKVIE